MNRFYIMALAAGLALTASASQAATKAAKAAKPEARAKVAKAETKKADSEIRECCAKGGCATCEAGNSAFFTSTSCGQCAAGSMKLAMQGQSTTHTLKSHANDAFFTATACSAKEENTVVKVAAESKPAAKPAAKPAKAKK